MRYIQTGEGCRSLRSASTIESSQKDLVVARAIVRSPGVLPGYAARMAGMMRSAPCGYASRTAFSNCSSVSGRDARPIEHEESHLVLVRADDEAGCSPPSRARPA